MSAWGRNEARRALRAVAVLVLAAGVLAGCATRGASLPQCSGRAVPINAAGAGVAPVASADEVQGGG